MDGTEMDLLVGRQGDFEVPNIFSILKREHGEVERLLVQLEVDPAQTTMDEAARVHLAQHLVMVESRHEAAEEMVFWPAVRKRLREGDALADRALAQEREAKYTLDALRFAASEESRLALVTEFARAARAHVAFEEEEVWPVFRKAIGHLGRWLLGMRYVFAERVGPTRPHPRGPDRPLGMFTRGIAVATLDRVRDKMTGRHA